jgi:nucleoid-associated protein YgaU
MSLELIKEVVRINQLIGADTTQTIVENDIIVPDVKPDIAHILLLDGDVYVKSAETVQEKLLVNGSIRYKILYVSDDPEQPVKSINTSMSFNYSMDIPNTRQGMKCRVKCDIEHMEYEILNSRKVNTKVIISLSGKVENEFEQSIVKDFDGVEGMQILRSAASVNSYIGHSQVGCPVLETLEIPAGKPAIREILRNDIKITGKDYKLTEDKVVAKGELNISTLYIGDDESGSIQFMEHEIPFTQFLDLPGIDEDSICEVDFDIADAAFTAEEDSDGELRQLKSEVMLNIFAEGSGHKEIELIEDAYSPASRMNIEKEPFNIEEFVSETKSQLILKETTEIGEDSPDISEVFNVLSKPSLSECKISDDHAAIEGVMVVKILYIVNNAEQPVFCCSREIPFKHSMDIKGLRAGMDCNIDMNIENSSYSMASSKEVEIRFVVGVTAKVTSQVSIPTIVRVTEVPLDDKRMMSLPSITIYFAQSGDTLWKIAKRYYTTIDEIKRVNSTAAETLNPGDQIIIPRKL